MCVLFAASSVQWPTCADHWELTFGSSYDTWYDWVWHSSYLPHGPVHVWIGGVGGQCESKFDKLLRTITKVSVARLKLSIFGLLKDMWRSELLETPKYCSTDAQEDCVFHCVRHGDNAETFYDTLKGYLETFSVTTLASLEPDATESYTLADLTTIADLMFCNTTYWPGDHLEAASPVEVSFWPIHPTLDRLLQYKVLAKPFTDKTWDFSSESSGSNEYCTTSTSGCDGHHAGDLTYWKLVVNEDGVYKSKTMTNQEVREAINPETYSMPYIYNHFKWSHCDSMNVTFTDVAALDIV